MICEASALATRDGLSGAGYDLNIVTGLQRRSSKRLQMQLQFPRRLYPATIAPGRTGNCMGGR
jgi:hypothetical protein